MSAANEAVTTATLPTTAAPSVRAVSVSFVLNGREVTWEGDPSAKLLDVLRDDLRLTGVKCGCREGECGACSILLDGVLVNSCMVAAGRVGGTEVTTIEGYCTTERFKVLDATFARRSAVQCGYCIPGMVLAAEALLSANPHPTEEEVRTGISGNLCRCTGYNAIVDAILDASKEGEGLW
jgi:carbon-monoxide dehydrogenase small subunit